MNLSQLIESLQAALNASYGENVRVRFADNTDNWIAVSVYLEAGEVWVDLELDNA